MNLRSTLLVFFLATTVVACRRQERIDVLEANLRASEDSVRVLSSKVGDIEFAKRISVLSREITVLQDELKETKGKIEVLTRTKARLQIDTLEVPTVVERHFEGLTAFWTYEDDALAFRGVTVVPDSGAAATTVHNFTVDVDLVGGIRQLSDDNYEFFVRPSDDRVTVDMEGLVVNRKRFGYTTPRKWVVGVGGGYGLGVDGFGPIVGVLLVRKLFAF